MHPPTDPAAYLATCRPGDRLSGTVAENHRGLLVTLDGFPSRPLAFVHPGDVSWGPVPTREFVPGRRVTGQVLSVDRDGGLVRLALTAAEHPRLWAFLSGLRPGELLTGTVAAIERFGVFVRLDEGPEHPVHPGVGFLTYPELAWHHFESVTDVVSVGERITCEFLQFDDWNGEARLSLRATRPDPFRAFADATAEGDVLSAEVTSPAPFGVFARVTPLVEGLIPTDGLARPVAPGEQVTVTVVEIDRTRRLVVLSQRSPGVAQRPDAPSPG